MYTERHECVVFLFSICSGMNRYIRTSSPHVPLPSLQSSQLAVPGRHPRRSVQEASESNAQASVCLRWRSRRSPSLILSIPSQRTSQLSVGM